MDGASYMVRGGVVLQNGLVTQNLVQGTSYTLQPAEFSMNTEVKPSLMVGVLYNSATVNTLEAVSAHNAPDGDISLRVSTQGEPLTMSAATQASMGVASAQIIAANTARRYLLISNTDTTRRVSLAFGAAAVIDTGITLQPGQSYEMSESAGNLTLQEVRGIAAGAATLLGVQEGV
jgi:hypothetical protein